jgi:phage terminase small subunit
MVTGILDEDYLNEERLKDHIKELEEYDKIREERNNALELYCVECDKYIPKEKVIWRNDTPYCECGNILEL